jgi:hypothetical protein
MGAVGRIGRIETAQASLGRAADPVAGRPAARAPTADGLAPGFRLAQPLSGSRVRRIGYGLLAADLAFGLLYVASFVVVGRGVGLLGLDAERSLPTWYASGKLLTLALIVMLVATTLRAGRWPVAALAGLFAFLSADEIATIHERLGPYIDLWLTGDRAGRFGSIFAKTGFWMVVLGPLLAAAFIGLGWRIAKTVAPGRAVTVKAIAGVAVFLASATLLEAMSNFASPGWTAVLQITVEEVGELVGVTLMLWAALELLGQRIGRLELVRS